MMSEKDHAPLSAACVRALHDKLYDKRKTAALEIEKMVKEFSAVNNQMQIKRLIKVVSEFSTSQNSHARKGGLIGLAAIAIALGKDIEMYTTELIYPILACFCDSDHRVRYFACESLYNVVKVARMSVLPHFSSIFSALANLATDPEQSVKNASELLDRLMKDIVTEHPSFDLESFMPLLRERIYCKKGPFEKQFVISWISVLDAVPNIDLVIHLSEILDGLFEILKDNTIEIKKLCDNQLGQFLRSIKTDPTRVDFASLIKILEIHAQSTDELVQLTALTWIKEFVQLSGATMFPSMPGILIAVLPCLAYDTDARRNIKDTATAINFTFMKLVSSEVDQFRNTEQLKNLNVSEMGERSEEIPINIDLEKVIKVLSDHLKHNSVQTKVAVLRWILHLYNKIPVQMFGFIEKLFPILLDILSDSSDEVVHVCLIVMAEIISSPVGNDTEQTTKDENVQISSIKTSQHVSSYYSKFFISLIKLFSNDKQLLENRGPFIIKQLCVLLNAEDIYRTLAQVLLTENDLKFASLMVEELGIILLTSSELFNLRARLKDLKTEECCSMFCCLYETWCHNPVATVTLCLLSQSYAHACDIIRYFANLEVTVEFLTEIDKLVQLLESPIFAYLRLELLEVPCDQHLVRALYGLLMLLPQSEAFHTLRARLACIPSLHLNCSNMNTTVKKDLPERLKGIDYDRLLKHFIEVQEKHKNAKHTQRIKNINNLEKEINNLHTDI